ncbi:MAG: DNA polymerase [Spirochaetia bacterium]|nr:DNA polymerase [Spirochaetia bacterium]
MEIRGFLFDIYNIEEMLYIWIIDEKKNLNLVKDYYYPVIYADARTEMLGKFVKRLIELDALARKPQFVEKIHFYKNQKIRVLELVISRPSILRKIKNKLFAFYGKMDIYHSDIDPVVGYLYQRNLYPTGKISVVCRPYNIVEQIQSMEPHDNYEYKIPSLRIMYLFLKHSHRYGVSKQNPLQIVSNGMKHTFATNNFSELLKNVNRIFLYENPDVIISSFGDQIIFPFLFSISQKYKIPLEFDRDNIAPSRRHIQTRGTSFNTYGSWIYRAPSYPLFGRWHIDAANSFTFKETSLEGVIEISRLSRIPVQKLARASTGSALTAIETNVGIKKNYLIPSQKSQREAPKTWYELLQKDKGGLVFQPDIENGKTLENVVQLDFSQMYPSIMNIHNISPETVNCPCCQNESGAERVPELNYHICQKRRGVVSDSLELILNRRKYFKNKKKTATGAEQKRAVVISDSLKWLNVVSFGYLGFRNAKFGKLESHECVTAYGRNKLLKAKEIAEDSGFNLVHAITDCIFIQKPDGSSIDEEHMKDICDIIFRETNIEMSIEGIFSWIVFFSSKTNTGLPVANRYMGRFNNGELKYRGIASRRKDTPLFIKNAQMQILEAMRKCDTVGQLKELHPEVHDIFNRHDLRIQEANIPWKELLFRKTVGKYMEDYAVENATLLSLRELSEKKIKVQPGEKIRYITLNHKSPDRKKRYITEVSGLTLTAKCGKTLLLKIILTAYLLRQAVCFNFVRQRLR